MADRRDEISSPMGCSAAAAVAAAPYADREETPLEGRAAYNKRRALTKPTKKDACHPRLCWRCGLVVPPCDGGVHENADACISALRDYIAMEKWTAPKDHRSKVKRQVAVTGMGSPASVRFEGRESAQTSSPSELAR